jgi:5'(3')-deoxyribonucleotidase/uncharacterized protein with PQ loop repeat
VKSPCGAADLHGRWTFPSSPDWTSTPVSVTLKYDHRGSFGVNWPLVTGIAAALCTTLAFVPQLFKIEKQHSTELSSAMLFIYLAGQVLWLSYGLMLRSIPLILANATSTALIYAVSARKAAAARRMAGSGRRLRIAVDMDEVMADALKEHIRRYNASFGAQVARADLHGRHLSEWIPPDHRDTLEAMLDSSFFAELDVLDDCVDVMRELTARHDVYIVTAAMDVPSSFDAKFRWLERHFTFIPSSNIVFCGDKGIIDADYLIDDRPRHFERFKGRPLLFSAPHNAGETRYPRVDSWKDIRKFFARVPDSSPS